MREEPTSSLPADRGHLPTEQRNIRSGLLHSLSVGECLKLMNAEDRLVADAVCEALPALTALVVAIEKSFNAGGRLIYVGAGTSGRLGVLDASEMPPTFQVEPGRIIGLIAGGEGALRRSSEGLEDDVRGAEADLRAVDLREGDALVGIAAGGTTPYVIGALQMARDMVESGAVTTGLLTCVPMDRPAGVDFLVVAPTGPEVLTGSTRLKAGTATKMMLNMISTTLMIRGGRVYGSLMVDMRASNAKLRDRAARIVAELTGLDRVAALTALDQAGGLVKTAVVMQRLRLELPDAEARLAEAGGRLERVIGD